MKRLVYLVGILLLAMACKEVYEEPPQSFLWATIYGSDTNKPISPVTTVQGVGVDYNWFGDTAGSNLLLPLTIKDTSRFIVWMDGTSDSLTFIHQTEQKYVSMETGFYYEYKILSVRFTQNRIDSVRITDSLVTRNWNENIKLYIHP
jgi:hypothetical protein